jgi:PncC family amidohydrolase
LTSRAGSSAYFYGGIISYSNQAKVDLLDINPSNLSEWGAVSEIIAKEMASGVRIRCGVQLGVAITGIAGPGGGSPNKPVGLVWIALASEEGDKVIRKQFAGDRTRIREESVLAALRLVLDYFGG